MASKIKTHPWENVPLNVRERLSYLYLRLHRVTLLDWKGLGFFPAVLTVGSNGGKGSVWGVAISSDAGGLEFISPLTRFHSYEGSRGVVVMREAGVTEKAKTVLVSDLTLNAIYAAKTLFRTHGLNVTPVSVSVSDLLRRLDDLSVLRFADQVITAFDTAGGTWKEGAERAAVVRDRLESVCFGKVVSLYDLVNFEPGETFRDKWFSVSPPVKTDDSACVADSKDFYVKVVDGTAYVYPVSRDGYAMIRNGDLGFLTKLFPLFEQRGVPCTRYRLLL